MSKKLGPDTVCDSNTLLRRYDRKKICISIDRPDMNPKCKDQGLRPDGAIVGL